MTAQDARSALIAFADRPDGTGASYWRQHADSQRLLVQHRSASGGSTWADILRVEVYEALAEDDPARLRAELIQIGAVTARWVEAIDRRDGVE